MKFITGKDRNQTEFFCLEQAITPDNEVRLIDLFVEAVKMQDYGFKIDFIANGRSIAPPICSNSLFMATLTASGHPGNLKKNANETLRPSG